MPQVAPANRRSNQREKIDVLMNQFVDGEPQLCRALDLSRSGMRLCPISASRRSIHVRHLGLEFELPGTDLVIAASGEAVFTDESRGEVGVRFTHMSPEDAAALAAFLD